MFDSEKHQLVTHSNHLIESSYKLSVQEQRLIMIMASMIKPTDEDFHAYRIDIKDFNEMIRTESKNNYACIKDLTKKMIGRVVTIKKPGSLLQTAWCSSAEYFDKRGYVELCFDPKLKPYLVQLKEFFTTFQLKFLMQFKSMYSFRIYQLSKQYQKIGKRTIEIKDLREMLKIEPEKYKVYKDFRKKTLWPAQREINEKTDIIISFEEHRKNRAVTAITFYITPNHDQKHIKLNDFPVETTTTSLYDRLVSYFLLTPDQAKEVLVKYKEADIIENLKHTERRHKKGEIKVSLGGYTLNAIKQNIQDQLSLFDIEKAEKETKAKETEIQKKSKDLQEKQYNEYRINKIKEFEATLPPDQLADIESQARQQALEERPGINEKWISPMVRINQQQRLADLAGVYSFEEWQNQNAGKPA